MRLEWRNGDIVEADVVPPEDEEQDKDDEDADE